jgi:pimeloyl-ACP methyl ester carboxylesterase
MKKLLRTLTIIFMALLIILLVGPFLIPIPPLKDTVPPRQLADPDSRFVQVHRLDVHYKIQGQGEPVFVLLHGFGASVFSWREVMAPLAEHGTVIAYDRPAFGLTERPLYWEGINPYSPEGQVELLVGLMDTLKIEQAILVGNSAGGMVALQTVLRYPERVQALVLVDAAIFDPPTWGCALLGTPQMRHLGPLLVRLIQTRGPELIRLAWHNPAKITPDVLEGYQKPLRVQDWDRALWELTIASCQSNLSIPLSQITQPTLVITGDDDRLVFPEQSIRLAKDLPNATLSVLTSCGHVPQEECPEQFMATLTTFSHRFVIK